jgi:hypothetical protein
VKYRKKQYESKKMNWWQRRMFSKARRRRKIIIKIKNKNISKVRKLKLNCLFCLMTPIKLVCLYSAEYIGEK